MYCRYCGKILADDSYFCPNCGAKQKEKDNLNPFGSNKFVEIIKIHKKIAYSYSAWLLVNIGLFIFAKPQGTRGRYKYDYSGDFYPFNCSLGNIFEGHDFNVNLLGVDRYDFSEFFFYVVLFPIALFGMVKCIPLILLMFKKIKKRYNQWKEYNTKKKVDYKEDVTTNKVQQKEDTNQEPIPFDFVTENEVSHVCEKTEVSIDELCISKEANVSIEKHPQQMHIQDEVVSNEVEMKVKKMPLFSRCIGSIIDKILILIIFVVGSVAISPYGTPGRFGTYIGLRHTPLELYEYIDKSQMNSYGTYSDGISKSYQDLVRQETEPPHIGSTLELDMNITFTFIILNLIFYILFESILSASPGKRMFGGVILDGCDDKIGFGKALIRGLCGGVLMVGVYFLLHLQGGLTNTIVVAVFFILLDLPVLFTKRSLLDIFTGTTYAKR